MKPVCTRRVPRTVQAVLPLCLMGLCLVFMAVGCDTLLRSKTPEIPGVPGQLVGWPSSEQEDFAKWLSTARWRYFGIEIGRTKARTEYFGSVPFQVPAQEPYLEAKLKNVAVQVLPLAGAGISRVSREAFDVAITAFIEPAVKDESRFINPETCTLRFQLLGPHGVVLREATSDVIMRKTECGATIRASLRFEGLSRDEVRSARVAHVFWLYSN